MKSTSRIIMKIRLFVLICATVFFVIALIFPNSPYQETLLDVSLVMLIAMNLALCIIDNREKSKEAEDGAEGE